MDSIRKQILAACLASLRTIQPGGGLRSTVPPSHVHRAPMVPSEFPAVVLEVGAERKEPSAHDLLTFRLALTIECWIDAQEGEPADEVEDLMADVRQVIQNDATFWGLIKELDDLGASAPTLASEDRRGVGTLHYELVYRHQRLNPSSP